MSKYCKCRATIMEIKGLDVMCVKCKKVVENVTTRELYDLMYDEEETFENYGIGGEDIHE